ncbi:MAG: nucleotidyltransferase domain-containing protein [Aliidongia sp.]
MLEKDGVTTITDPVTRDVAGAVTAALHRRFGHRLQDVYLFGSRAHGCHQADSDLDIAVVLRGATQALSIVDRELLDVTYPIELDHGVHIQAWALPAGELNGNGFRARLATTIRKEGIRL